MMNQKNFEFLRDQVKYTGFGEGLAAMLGEQIAKQQPAFTLTHENSFGKDAVTTALYFKKSAQRDLYFFNAYQMKLKKEYEPEVLKQTFYINKDNTFTMKEAYNLMSGRAVNKDLTNKAGQQYNAWIQMDFGRRTPNGNHKFNQYHQHYGYDLEKVLSRHPIEELKEEAQKMYLLASLKKGNRQSATVLQEGNRQKCFIEANPKFKTLNIYDGYMRRLYIRQPEKEQHAVGQSQKVKSGTKKEQQVAGESEGEILQKTKKKSKRKANKIA